MRIDYLLLLLVASIEMSASAIVNNEQEWAYFLCFCTGILFAWSVELSKKLWKKK